MMPRLALVALPLAVMSAPASARDRDGFAGPYVGAAASLTQHHFILEETGPSGTTSRNVSAWGPAGTVFAGLDFDLGSRFVAGVEGEFDFGGHTPRTTAAGGQVLAIKPRYGYGATAHLGVRAGASLLLYGKAGYGEHRYRTTLPAGAGNLHRNASFILGAGAEARVSRRLSVRLDLEHLDGSRNRVSIGIPLRF